jgi:hypothetical protein
MHRENYTPSAHDSMPRRVDDWYDYFAAAVLVALLTVCALAYFDILTK